MLRAILLTATVLAATGASALSPEREREYQALAGRAAGVADACLALGVPVHPEGMLLEIANAMESFGGAAGEIEEWRDAVVLAMSPRIREVLSRETPSARHFYCIQTMDSHRRKLRNLLAADPASPPHRRAE